MSTNLGPLLPQLLVDHFSGADLQSKVGLASVLVTPGADGYPHPAIVTPGEIVASDPSTLRVALYLESSASRNLRERKTGTLCLALDKAAYYVKFDAEPFASDAEAFKGFAVFTLRPKHVLKDTEEGAEMTSGFRFRDLRGEEALLAQWTTMIGALRGTFAGG